jgi:hypothetical protein
MTACPEREDRRVKKLLLLLFISCLFIPISPQTPHANMELKDRGEVFGFLKEAFQAQAALSEKERTKEEIDGILSPYFSKDYQKEFLKENLKETNGKYLTYASDFAKYYIPFYRYSNNTRVVIKPDKIYVFEYFPESNEGPVGYKSHYEGILLENLSGVWKISKYLYDEVPKEVIKESL